jgi:antitoxin VapB
MTSLYIKNGDTAALVEQLAIRMGTTKTEAVRIAVAEKLARDQPAPPPVKRSVKETLEEFWRTHPLPPETGLKADKAFFDELSGDL